MQIIQSRRDFLASMSAAGAAGVSWQRHSARRRGAAGDDHRPLSEGFPNICFAPQYVAEELLRAEGFTDIRYVEKSRAPQPRKAWRKAISISARAPL